MDKAHDGHGVANQMAKLEQKARERGWTVVYRLSDGVYTAAVFRRAVTPAVGADRSRDRRPDHTTKCKL